MYSQFCLCYQRYARGANATMRMVRKPGESAEVDWAGQKGFWLDPETGERFEASIFVGVLSSSRYAYVEAFPSQNQESWLNAHANMFRYFGGVPRILIPDNLKTGVTKPDRYEPVVNRLYRELAEHYGTAVIPARVGKPRDKANAEGTVGAITTWILAALRDRNFFSLRELNEGIREKLDPLPNPSRRRRDRLDAFSPRRKTFSCRCRRIRMNSRRGRRSRRTSRTTCWSRRCSTASRTSTSDTKWSTPDEERRESLLRRPEDMLPRPDFRPYRTVRHGPSHMPPSHRSTGSGRKPFIEWAATSSATKIVMRGLLSAHKIEQQAYKSCQGLVRLGDVHSFERLEAACGKALLYTPRPGYRNVRTILTTGQDRVESPTPERKAEAEAKGRESLGGIVRGAEYYRGGNDQC